MTEAPRDRRLRRRSLALGTLVAVVANTLGAVVIIALLVVVLPVPDEAQEVLLLNVILSASYVVVAVVVGILFGLQRARRRMAWLAEGRPPTERDRDAVVGLPWAITRLQLLLWLVATLLFAAVNLRTSAVLAAEVAVTVLIGGLVSGMSSYLLVERTNRPVLARTLEEVPLGRPRATGVAWRTVVSWTLGTALPVGGLVLLNGLAIGLDIDRQELAIATFVLGLTGLVFGLVIMIVLARSIADPLGNLRRALAALGEGQADVRVPVTDATEVGVVLWGFNRMAEGLDERDRLRDLFGRHVGADLARKALDEGVELGGELREVAVLFVDVIASTALAEQTPPDAVVDRLNAFLGTVVEVVDAHGGTVDAFQGDAALAVWGAPLAHDDACGAALAAGRELAARLADDPALLDAGIGVSAGRVVAGHIGAAERLQYTVIGDPVNEAARLSDQAKQVGGRLLASGRALDGAAAGEASCWRPDGEVVLRGRSTPTALHVPRTSSGA